MSETGTTKTPEKVTQSDSLVIRAGDVENCARGTFSKVIMAVDKLVGTAEDIKSPSPEKEEEIKGNIGVTQSILNNINDILDNIEGEIDRL